MRGKVHVRTHSTETVEQARRDDPSTEAPGSAPARTGRWFPEKRHGTARPVLVAAQTLPVVVGALVASPSAAFGSARPLRTVAAARAAASTPPPVYEVRTGEVHGLGKVLVDGQGFTLYVFAPDKRSGTSKCYGKCAAGWPPLVLPPGVTKAPAGSGVRSALLGKTKRTDGTVQVTYNKWPLYTWVIDSAPGDATGQDLNSLGGKWYVITTAGKLITKHQ
jgi:predicted lipoprotein with Yx(FWY)xxD motif